MFGFLDFPYVRRGFSRLIVLALFLRAPGILAKVGKENLAELFASKALRVDLVAVFWINSLSLKL